MSSAQFRGLPISAGKVHAAVCLYNMDRHLVVEPRTLVDDAEVVAEIARFEDALDKCTHELERVAAGVRSSVGRAEAEIFTAQRHILNDPAIVGAIRDLVRQNRINVEEAVSRVFSLFEDRFLRMDNTILRERSTDIGEVRRRLISVLVKREERFVCEGFNSCSRGTNRIIVADEMTADMMVHMNADRVLGIVTEKGGPGSHAAIIARSLGIPAVSGVRGVLASIACGTELLVDGDTGEVFVSPDAEFVRRRIPEEQQHPESACHLVSPPGTEVFANASTVDDVKQAATVRADGIGLYRTEILFLRAERLLSEDEQYDHYRQVVHAAQGRPVTFRLIDVGGDKELPFLRIEKEDNPFLGFRGARFLLGNPDILAAQVRAIARLAAEAPVRIMFPMIIDTVQLERLTAQVRQIISSLPPGGFPVQIGTMIETPSAALQARDIARIADFISIGSNDLTQYLFAVDRNNALVSADFNPQHPVLWQVLADIAAAAAAEKTPLSICGEMAGAPGMASRLVGIGIRSLSVSSRLVPRVRGELHREPVVMPDIRD